VIRIVPAEPTDQAWVKWRQGCREACDNLKAAFQAWDGTPENKPKVTSLYGGQRASIVRMFYLKCAYCEVLLGPGNRAGQLDHYRPKGSVRTARGQPVSVTWHKKPSPRPHPGYYWLAYEFTNLVPVCAACNNRTSDLDGSVAGKRDWFPMAKDEYSVTPGGEIAEDPLLLNPWYDDPTDHMLFAFESGRIVPTSDKGEATVELLGLNSDALVQARRHACDDVAEKYTRYMQNRVRMITTRVAGLRAGLEAEVMDLSAEFRRWRIGDAEFSAFRVSALDSYEKEIAGDLRRAG
jgi:hypothetical protein